VRFFKSATTISASLENKNLKSANLKACMGFQQQITDLFNIFFSKLKACKGINFNSKPGS
jgi:hypothetical protein